MTRLWIPMIVVLSAVVGLWLTVGASANSSVNRGCFRNRIEKPFTLRWWADCANAYGPHAFTFRELRASRGRPRKIERSGGIKYVEYRRCSFGFNRRGQAVSGLCL